jgi:hypothetical protein
VHTIYLENQKLNESIARLHTKSPRNEPKIKELASIDEQSSEWCFHKLSIFQSFSLQYYLISCQDTGTLNQV